MLNAKFQMSGHVKVWKQVLKGVQLLSLFDKSCATIKYNLSSHSVPCHAMPYHEMSYHVMARMYFLNIREHLRLRLYNDLGGV